MQQSERGVNLEQGENIVLFASAARGAAPGGVTGVAVQILGERLVYTWLLDITDAQSDGTDTLDVYIDTLFGATWINIVHFTQILGNGADAITRFVVTVPANMLTTDDATAACAVGVARGVVGSQFRGRYVEVDGGGAASTFTFSLVGYAL
jgi:hypothetical protein